MDFLTVVFDIQGGVRTVFTPEEAEKLAAQMIGHKLITKQTGEKGILVNKVGSCLVSIQAP